MRKGGKEGKKESGSVSRCESSTQRECESGNAILLAVVVTTENEQYRLARLLPNGVSF